MVDLTEEVAVEAEFVIAVRDEARQSLEELVDYAEALIADGPPCGSIAGCLY